LAQGFDFKTQIAKFQVDILVSGGGYYGDRGVQQGEAATRADP
jgi:hypothetical protein